MAEKKVIELEVSSNLGNLKQQLKQAQVEVQSLSEKFGATSKQAVEAAKAAAILKDKIGDAKALTDAFNPDAKFKAVTGALTGVAGGFSVLTGAMGAFGKQNEDVEKAILKVQSAMAIASGLQAIGESIDSFKQLGAVIKSTAVFQGIYNFVQTGSLKATTQSTVAKVADAQATVAQGTATVATTVATTGATTGLKLLRAAMISTGIGALVAGVGLLIANFDKVTAFFSPVTDGLKSIGESLGLYNYTQEKANIAQQKADATTIQNSKNKIKEIDKQKEKLFELLKIQENSYITNDQALGQQIALMKIQQKDTTDLERARLKATIAYQGNILNETKALDDQLKAKEKITLAELAAIGARTGDYKAYNNFLEKSYAARNENLEKNEQAFNSYVESTNQLQLLEAEVIQKGVEKTKAAIKRKAELKKEADKAELDRLKTLKENIASLDEEIRISKLTEEEKEIYAVNKKYTKLIEQGKKAKINISTLEEEKRLSLAAITKKYDDADASTRLTISQNIISEMVTAGTKRLEGEKLISEKSIQIAKEEKEKKALILQQQLDLVKDSFQAFADVATLFAGKNKKAQKAAFNIQKGANIAATTIDTYTAAMAAYKSALAVPVIGTALAPVAAAGAVAVGLMNIKKIAASQFEGSGTPSTGGNGGGATAPTMSAPQFNVVGQSGVNQLASLHQQPVQAYVVSGQVTSQQALDRNRLANATLGG